MKMDEVEIKKILKKWDEVPMPEDPYAEARLGCARVSCGMLEHLVDFPKKMQIDLVLVIAHLARKALLTHEEKVRLFGKGMIENALAERILADGCSTAIILAALEWVDLGRFPQAAALFTDIKQEDWPRVAFEWESQWELCHNPDAALVRLLAHRCGGVDFEQSEIDEMERVAREQCPKIDEIFNLIEK
jgi:hypothetical protein